MSLVSKTRQSSVITLVIALFLLTTAVFAFADDGTTGDAETAAQNARDAATATTSALADTNASASTTGQPPQGCDQNGQGTGGPYDSTCDGSPSENGNGGGGAGGKPCAGCVGAADNKNPKGQLPGPQDHNNGYECDGNNGIAKGNPAHTGCAVTTTTVPVTTTTVVNTTTTTVLGHASICHATGSLDNNPYVLIGPSPVGVIFGHLGQSHQDGRDIIPPFQYDADGDGIAETYSQNWDAAHQAIFFNGCNVSATTTTAPVTTTTAPVTTTTVVTTTTLGSGNLTLCHATGSETEPYVKLTLPADEAYNDHFLVDADDIFPPFTYNGTDYPGLNWTAENQITYENDCALVLGTTIVNTTTTTEAPTTTTEAPTTTTEGDTVLPTQVTQPGGTGRPHPSKPVLPRRNPPDRVLPFTGSDPSPFIGMAGLLMAVGGSLVLASRRRRLGY